MIPRDALLKTHSVYVYYHDYWHCICGFKFFDKDGALLWKIGWVDSRFDIEYVYLEENEVIVGVVAKLYQDDQSRYTDF